MSIRSALSAMSAMSALHPPAPADAGLTHEGRLRACPTTPNAVCSEDPDPARRVEPLPYGGDPADARVRLRRVLAGLPRVAVVADDSDYVRAEARSRVFRFVDDVEFLFDDAARIVHVRSASRVGRSDMGANRLRAEAIRRAWDSA